jgi:hypothetical protein
MSFDDFAANLATTLSTGKMDGFYDFHIAKLSGMNEGNRRAHISSMKMSQKHDYNAELRVVITEDDTLRPGADPWSIASYVTPSLDYAITMAKQVVIRRDGTEKVVKG